MRRQLLPALRAMLILTVLVGVAYPLAITAAAQAFFGDRADGSIVQADSRPVGSALLGQAFTGDEYFWPRPSAAGDGYDPQASGASNLGPTNPELTALVAERAAEYRRDHELPDDAKVPVDAVTASGSGLDPHISVANARLQAPRVAAARDLPLDAVMTALAEHTHGRDLGFLGEPRVHVLQLNLTLDGS